MSEEEKADLPWLTAAVDQRLALLKSRLPPEGVRLGTDVIMLSLTEPAEDATEAEMARWERTCDNCRVYCPPRKAKSQEFYTGTVGRKMFGTQVIITFGACARCAGKR